MEYAQKDFQKLQNFSKHIRVLSGISHLLEWDQETHMPPGATNIRSVQLKTLAGIIHAERTGKRFSQALSKLIDVSDGTVRAQGLTHRQQACLREWRRDFVKEKALPKKFVEEMTRLTSQSVLVWREARKSSSFQRFAPFLDKLVTMSRKKADYLGFENHPYDALLDLYEPGMTTQETSQLFNGLKKETVKLLKKISQHKKIDNTFLHGKFSEEKQLSFAKKILEEIGYSWDNGRLDLSTHPFSSSSHPTDSRITLRIHPSSILSIISIALHEGGHALYEMGLPLEHYGTPLGEAISMGMHESQSRWWETRIGLSKPFWKHYLPLLKEQFPKKFENISLETFYRGINRVERSLIRVEADEVTYPLHVILRFEIEKGLFEGQVKVRDLPEIWNGKMEELLGIRPGNDGEGCLQDIHWSMGAFGYFPTYALGTLYTSHLFEAFAKEHNDWEGRVGQGELEFIKDWLQKHVYQYGREFSSMDLLKKVTGKKFTADAYNRYVEKKYSEIYSE